MRCPRWAGIPLALLALAGSARLVPAQTRPAAPSTATGSGSSVQNAAILSELKAIRALLEKLVTAQAPVPAPSPAPVPTERGALTSAIPTTYVMGRADAPLTMVEFTDLQCPFCRRFTSEAFERIKREFVDTGKVRFVSRDLPLDSIHRLARAAARVSRCAAEQGKGIEMRHAILANNSKLAVEMFPQFAVDLGLEMAPFSACTNDVERLDAAIQADMDAAKSLGLNGTPGFLIGRTVAAGLEGVKVSGAFPFESFKAVIDAQLAQISPAPTRR